MQSIDKAPAQSSTKSLKAEKRIRADISSIYARKMFASAKYVSYRETKRNSKAAVK
jgi:hypothetical protein